MEQLLALPNIYGFITILAMAITTYFTRVVGFLWLRKYSMSERFKAVLENSPAIVMIAVAAPAFMTDDIKMQIALLATIVIAFKFNLGITIVASVAMMGIMQNFL